MKKLLTLVVLINLLYACGPQKATLTEIQTSKPVKLYETTKDYLNNNPMDVHVRAVIKDSSKQHITVKKFIDAETGLKNKKALSAWALNYNGKNYFNLGYSDDVNHWRSYAKFDIEGRYCAIIVDDNSPVVLRTNGNYYGGGLTGVLISESSKWNKNWKDKNGKKKKIIFIDTQKIKPKLMNRNPGSLGNYLTRRQLKKIIKAYNIDVNTDKIKDVSFEKVIEIINYINSKEKE